MSEQKLNLSQKLIEIRKSVSYIKKETKGNNGKYASGAQVLGALKIKMDELGVLLEPHIENKESMHYEQKTNNGSRAMIEVKADMVMVWVDAESGEERKIPFACFGAQNDIAKAFGTALTYSERYFMLKYFNIPTDELDPEAFQRKAEDTTTKPPEPKKSFIDYKADAEKCETLALFNDWLFSNKATVKADLDEQDTHKFGVFVGEMKDMFAEQSGPDDNPASESPVETIICPNDNKECTVKECSVAMECNTTCQAYKEATK